MTRPNWIDRAVAYVAPRTAARRLAARITLDQIGQVRAYAGAKPGGRRDSWWAPGTSANTEIGAALPRLRNNIRALVRDNPYAERAVSVWVAHVVGDGITGRPVPVGRDGQPDERLATAIREVWAAWAESRQCDADGRHDFYGLQALAVRAMRESGEAIIRLRPRRADDGLPVPLQLQVMEGDHLDLSKSGPNGDNIIVQGVEFDPLGRRAAYWLFPEHPGGSVVVGRATRSFVSRRVPADRVIHLYQARRPGQVRGVPDLAPVVTLLKDLGDYDEAIRVRAKIEACLTAFITSLEQGLNPALGVDRQRQDDGATRESFEPGMINRLRPGEDVKIHAPTGSGSHNDYRLSGYQGVAVGVDLTYDLITGDLRQANYSSLRAGRLTTNRRVSQAQWHTVIPVLCDPVAEAFTAAGASLGLWPAPSVPWQWSPQPPDEVDPLKAAQAVREKLAMGLRTPQQAILGEGFDPATQVAELAEWNAMLEAAGVSLPQLQLGAPRQEQPEEDDDARRRPADD